MLVSQFSFDLPEECIAQAPVTPRDSARLLEVGGDVCKHRIVRELVDLLHPGDIMVFNDTRVLPSRLIGKRGEAKVEVTLHKAIDNSRWKAFAKPARKLNPGDKFIVSDDFYAEVEARDEGEVTLAFNRSGDALITALHKHGIMPLPPYIGRKEGERKEDRERYQTVYAREEGAVAAPTAGLHFTPELLQALRDKGVEQAFVTLHVGAGTFLPVKVEDTKDHKMHSEFGVITQEVAAQINAAKARGGRIVSVGTTSLRLLESAANDAGEVLPFAGDTDIFITPGYRFKTVDVLMTNFHLPESTLFMLVSAFAGFERMKAAYAEAIEQGYRFYSYGDASLLSRL